jgi:hypothetical protein
MATPLGPARPVTANASDEARRLLDYLHAQNGKRTLSGQMWVPWGDVDEIAYVHAASGKYPAIRGHDFIHEAANAGEVSLAIDWWRQGGIPTLMWHWGAPAVGEGYECSKGTIEIVRCFEDGTPEHDAMWRDLARIGDHLSLLRDARVPVLWRPLHEFDGHWFWWSKCGPQWFVRLWETMFDYLANQRRLDNLLWVLCHTGDPKPDWIPGRHTFDIAGADTYGGGVQGELFRRTRVLHGNDWPTPLHECGEIPDPETCQRDRIDWSWWMLWHSRHLTNHPREAIARAYNHPLTVTLDQLPRWT